MSEIALEAPKGERILRYGLGIQIEQGPLDLWWSHERRQWERWPVAGGCSNTAPCATFRAFKRHVRKHRAALAGCTIRWATRYVGHGAIAVIEARP